MRIIFVFLVILLFSADLWAQQYPGCGTDLFKNQQTHSDYMNRQTLLDDSTYRVILKKRTARNQRVAAAILTVPVVVHVIHNGGAENISNAQVLQAIKDLNDAFAHLPPFNGADGVDTEIQFCLAVQDPDGNPTTGINRIISPLTNVDQVTQDLLLKDLKRWDPTSYLNIWVVKEICAGSGCSTAGYAYLASAHGANFDGVVTEAAYFGSSTTGSKILVHEVGHYLNLYHTFEGACGNSDCLLNGDRICDTPPDSKNTPSPGCVPENTCATDADDKSASNPFTADVNDKINNYMDYSGQACQNAFTAGQKERMLIALTGIRGSLLNSKGCTVPCLTSFDVSFTHPLSKINIGENLVFTNNSKGTITGYEWSVDSTVESTSSTLFSRAFATGGIKIVKLKGWNTDPLCLAKEYMAAIEVVCPVAPDFSASGTEVGVNTKVYFSNTTPAASLLTFTWYVDGVSVGASLSNYTFTTVGTHHVTLEASNGVCTKSKSLTIVVNNTGGLCTNMDFETGTTANWLGYMAKFDYTTGTLVPIVPGMTTSRHAILNTGYDAEVGGTILPCVAPGGKYSLRLEDLDVGGNASIIEQKFLVTAANSNFAYQYAVVLENPGHESASNPFFNIHMTDESGAEINCAAYSVIAEPPFTGFTKVTGKEVYYKNWTKITVPLSAYIGQNVTIRFTVADCSLGGHFGYAYLDGSCLPAAIKSTASVVCSGETVVLEGPSGFSSYSWTGPGIVGSSTVPTITVNQPGTYTLQVGSEAGPTCKATMSITLGSTVTSLTAGADVTICSGNAVQLLASKGSTYKWTPATGLSNPNIADPIASPLVTTTYTVTSCGVTDQVTVNVIPNFGLAVTPDMSICDNRAVVGLNALPTPSSGIYSYHWTPGDSSISDDNVQSPIVTLTGSKKYYVKVTDLSNGCVKQDSVTINLEPTLNVFAAATPEGLCKNSAVTTVTLTATSSLPAPTVKWYESGSFIGSGASMAVSPKHTTTYTVESTIGTCKASSSVTVPYFTVNGGPDKRICDKAIQLDGTYDGESSACTYKQAVIAYNALTLDASWTMVSMADDEVTDSIDIGFSFVFYCNAYKKTFISSNGYILFNPANGKSPLPQKLPDLDVPNNLIAMAWGELLCRSGATGCVFYKQSGTAPNRIFQVYFKTTEKDSNPIQPTPVRGYITLFENTNVIEIHIEYQGDDVHNHTLGIENGDGTLANVFIGKNKEKWREYQKAYRFTPQYNVVYNWTPTPLSGGNTLTPIVFPAVTTTYTVTADNGICVSSDQVKVTVDCTPLYVDFLSFEVKAINDQAQLTWATAKEENNSHYMIERSSDGTQWQTIGRVNGNGTTRSLSSYQYTDQQTLAGTTYYRLVQYDFSNVRTYSVIKSVYTQGKEFTAALYPNPFSHHTQLLVLTNEQKTVKVLVKDVTGKVLLEQEQETNQTIELGATLESGMYTVEILSGNYKEVYKMVKYKLN